MTLQKAIEILTFYHKNHEPYSDPDLVKALKLCKDATERLLFARSWGDPHTLALLPGED